MYESNLQIFNVLMNNKNQPFLSMQIFFAVSEADMTELDVHF